MNIRNIHNLFSNNDANELITSLLIVYIDISVIGSNGFGTCTHIICTNMGRVAHQKMYN